MGASHQFQHITRWVHHINFSTSQDGCITSISAHHKMGASHQFQHITRWVHHINFSTSQDGCITSISAHHKMGASHQFQHITRWVHHINFRKAVGGSGKMLLISVAMPPETLIINWLTLGNQLKGSNRSQNSEAYTQERENSIKRKQQKEFERVIFE